MKLLICVTLLYVCFSANAQIDSYSIDGNKIFIFNIGHFVVYKDGTSSLQPYQLVEEGETIFKINFDGSFMVVSSKIQLRNSQNYVSSLITLLSDKRISGNISALKANKVGSTIILYTGDKVSRIGTVPILYTGSKISRIGNTTIWYTGDKVTRIGDTAIWYTGDIVSRIGDINIWCSGNKVIRVGDTAISY